MKFVSVRNLIALTILTIVIAPLSLFADEKPVVKVGVPTPLSGELAILGLNIQKTVETYRKHMLRHPIEFIFEDAGITSQRGLSAYQALINIKKVDMLIGGTSSNGTMAGSSIINSSKTVMITPVTGGSNVDHAGEYIFRIGNSDLLNGSDQASYYKSHAVMKVALLTEQTEYTDDIAQTFRKSFLALGGKITFDDTFSPGTTDFRSVIAKIAASHPDSIFLPTQTGTSLALFLKQLSELGNFKGEIHTTFVAAPNPDTRKIAGDLVKGVHYLDPSYDKKNPALIEFFRLYKGDHGQAPDIAFHTAGTVDALNMLQDYLDKNQKYDREGFKNYLLTAIKDYKGLMGVYSFDQEGNSNLGFEPAVME